MGFLKSLFSGKEESPEERAEQQKAKDFDILKYDGVRALRMGQTDYAMKCFNKALEIKTDAETQSYLAAALMNVGKIQEARDLLITLTSELPQNAEAWLALARADRAAMEYESMEQHAAQALNLNAENAEALYLSAEAKHEQGDDLNAIAMLTRALVIDERLLPAHLLRAKVLLRMTAAEEAEKDIDYVLQAQGEEPQEETVQLKATARLALGDADGAIAQYERLIKQNPLCEEAYIALCGVLAAHGRADKAMDVIDEAIDLMPQSAACFKERGRVRLQLHDKAGAMDDLKRSLELDPEAAAALAGNFTNIEEQTKERYKQMNPYGF